MTDKVPLAKPRNIGHILASQCLRKKVCRYLNFMGIIAGQFINQRFIMFCLAIAHWPTSFNAWMKF